MYAHICTCAHRHAYAHTEHRKQHFPCSSTTHILYFNFPFPSLSSRGSGSCPLWSLPDAPASVSVSHVLSICYMGAENPNLGLLACKAGNLVMESSPSPLPKVLMVFGDSWVLRASYLYAAPFKVLFSEETKARAKTGTGFSMAEWLAVLWR